MKKIFIIIAMFLFVACSNEKSNKEIRDEIFMHKEKIVELEKLLKETDSTAVTNGVINVNILEVEKKPVVHTFKVTGTAEAENTAFISPEINGQIKKIYVKEGNYVKKGTLLISLNSEVIQSSIAELKSSLALAKIMFKKQETLWNQKVGKEVDYLQAKNQKESLEAKLNTLKAQLQMSEIRAPFNGIVDEIYGNQGELAIPGRQIVQFVNLSTLKISADVSERYLPAINKGDSAKITFPSFPDLHIKTKVSRIGNVVKTANRTFTVEIKMPNPGNKVKPNMIAQAELVDYKGDDFLVPSIIVKTDRVGEFIYIIEEKDKALYAKKIYIKTGYVIGSEIIVKSGLKESDKVIIEGYSLVKNMSKVNILN